MKKYIITDIGRDLDRGVLERIGLGIKSLDTEMKLNVYCLDDQEYIDGDKARKNGDIIEGDLYIQYAEFCKKTDLKLMHKWIGPEQSRVSSQIEVVVKVTKIIDDYTICGITDFIGEEIPIELYSANDNKKLFKEKDTILISRATLCIDILGCKKKLREYCGL